MAVVCEQRGTAVTNVYGETILIWERLSNGSWIPNAFVDTGTSSWTPGIPRCSYNRSASASWAKANEQVQIAQVDPSNQCAAFASMVLWAGGIATTSTWNLDARGNFQFIRADTMVRSAAATV